MYIIIFSTDANAPTKSFLPWFTLIFILVLIIFSFARLLLFIVLLFFLIYFTQLF